MNLRHRWTRTHPAISILGLFIGAGLAALALAIGVSHRAAGEGTASPSWARVGLAGQLVHSLAVHAASSALVIAGAHDGIYRRYDRGRWTRVLRANDVWDVVLLPDGKTIVGADNDGYIDISHDAGVRWRRTLVSPTGSYAVSVQPGQPEHVLAGAGGGLFLSIDGGVHWSRRLALPNSAGAAFAWQPGSDRVVYAGAVSGGVGGSTLVYVSHDAGQTWHVYGRRLNSTGGIMSLEVLGIGRVYAGTMGNAVWRVAGATSAWRKSASGMPQTSDHVAGFAELPGYPDVLFAGTLGHGVFRTNDGGRHWIDISGTLDASLDSSIVTSVVYSGQDHALLAGTNGGIYALSPITRPRA